MDSRGIYTRDELPFVRGKKPRSSYFFFHTICFQSRDARALSTPQTMIFGRHGCRPFNKTRIVRNPSSVGIRGKKRSQREDESNVNPETSIIFQAEKNMGLHHATSRIQAHETWTKHMVKNSRISGNRTTVRNAITVLGAKKHSGACF